MDEPFESMSERAYPYLPGIMSLVGKFEVFFDHDDRMMTEARSWSRY
jgi:hypothetical protein